jgi:hypothetical protein
MSQEGLDIKKATMKNYFTYHPDSVDVQVVDSGEMFKALFDKAFMYGDKSKGNVAQLKRAPHLTFYSGDSTLLDERGGDSIIVDGATYKVQRIACDNTQSTFQCEAWLL